MTYASNAFNALGDPRRRELFERLSKSPLAVSELSKGLPVSRPAVSQHLKVLKKAGLVKVRKQGTRNIYYVNPDGVQAMRNYLDKFWNKALLAFKEAAEK